MDSRLNALIVEARRHDIERQCERPRLDATPTVAISASRTPSRQRHRIRRFLRRRVATQE